MIGMTFVIPIDPRHVEDTEAAHVGNDRVWEMLPEVLEKHALAQSGCGDRQTIDVESFEYTEYRQGASQDDVAPVFAEPFGLAPLLERKLAEQLDRALDGAFCQLKSMQCAEGTLLHGSVDFGEVADGAAESDERAVPALGYPADR